MRPVVLPPRQPTPASVKNPEDSASIRIQGHLLPPGEAALETAEAQAFTRAQASHGTG